MSLADTIFISFASTKNKRQREGRRKKRQTEGRRKKSRKRRKEEKNRKRKKEEKKSKEKEENSLLQEMEIEQRTLENLLPDLLHLRGQILNFKRNLQLEKLFPIRKNKQKTHFSCCVKFHEEKKEEKKDESSRIIEKFPFSSIQINRRLNKRRKKNRIIFSEVFF